MSFSLYQATTKLSIGGDEGKRNGVILKSGDQIRFDGTVVEVVLTGESFVNPTVQLAIDAGDLFLVSTEIEGEPDALTEYIVGPVGSSAAYTSIKTAVDAAGLVATPTSPQTILVRSGTYTETALISLPPNVTVEGVSTKGFWRFMENNMDSLGVTVVNGNWNVTNTSGDEDEWVSLANMKLFAYNVALPIIEISSNAGSILLRNLSLEGTAADTSSALLVTDYDVQAVELQTMILTDAHTGVLNAGAHFIGTNCSFINGAGDAVSSCLLNTSGETELHGCQTVGTLEVDGGTATVYDSVLSGESPSWSDNPVQVTSGGAWIQNCFLRGIGNTDGWPVEGAGAVTLLNSIHESGHVHASATLTVNREDAPGIITVTDAAKNLANDARNTAQIYTMTNVGARTVTLASSTKVTKDFTLTVLDGAGTAGASNITVSGNGSNINGSASYVMATNWQSANFIYDGTNWWAY